MLFNSLLLLLFSFSLRSPNLENISVYDYEILAGVEGKISKVAYTYERENGKCYTNSDIVLKYKYIEFTNYQKTSKHIDSQKFSFLYPSWKGIRVGLSYSLDNWANPNILFTVAAKGELFSIRYSEGVSRMNMDVDVKKPFKVKDRINLVPIISLRKYNDAMFYQAKVGFEYVLQPKKEKR